MSYPISGLCDPNNGNVTISMGSLANENQTKSQLNDKTYDSKFLSKFLSIEALKIFPCNPVNNQSSKETLYSLNSSNSEVIASINTNGEFSGEMDLRFLTANPPHIRLTQGSTFILIDTSNLPVNDQQGPSSAPIATAPSGPVGGNGVSTYNLPLSCNEPNEVVSITGNGIDPNPQTYTCTDTGLENLPLSLILNTEEPSPNQLYISSKDAYGNIALSETYADVPIDTLGPRVSVTHSQNVVEGQTANFTITITDESLSSVNYTVNTSGAETYSYTCSTNPCELTTRRIDENGTLTLTVPANSITDDLGNTGDSTDTTDTLTILAPGTLAFNPLPRINTQNNTSYPVSGQCDSRLGNVTVSISGVTKTIACDAVSGTSNGNGTFTDTMNVTTVTLPSPTITVTQGLNTVHGLSVTNDQVPITQAPSVPDQNPVNGTSVTLNIPCNEVNEVLTFSGTGLQPNPKNHTCSSASPSSESVILRFAPSTETSSSNSITVNSVDGNGNPTTNTNNFILPIDNVAPTVSVSASSDVIVGSEATFTITVTDGNSFSPFSPTVNSGNINSGNCSSSPCTVTVSDSTEGVLSLIVPVGVITDAAGNTNTSLASDSLTVNSSNLSVNELSLASSLNANNYPVSGSCEASQGNVNIVIGTPNVSTSVNCSGGSYNATLDVTSVTSNPMTVSVTQGTHTVSPNSSPENDQIPITQAPSVPDQNLVNGTSVTLNILCNEVNEVLTFSGTGLQPNPQNHTCSSASPSSESVILSFAPSTETSSSNSITVNSVDGNANPTTNTNNFILPIDNVAPTVSVSASSDVIVGSEATFTITVTDGNSFSPFSPTVNSGNITSGNCSSSPCTVTVSDSTEGVLSLMVPVGAITDAAGNTNTSLASDSLTVNSSNLSVNELSLASSLNADNYPVSGSCGVSQGNVNIVIGTPNISTSVNCSGGSYNATLDVTSVTSNPMTISVTQGTYTVSPNSPPENDQEGPLSAPLATAPNGAVGGSSYDLMIACNEANEEVQITGGQGLNPNRQNYICTSNAPEAWTLTLTSDVEISDPNNFTLSSEDEHENPAGTTTSVNIPIDTLGPRVSITNGGNITEGSNATFTITITDPNLNSSSLNYTPTLNQSSATMNPSSCTTNPCSLIVSGATEGQLTLTVEANDTDDSLLNEGPASSVTSSLSVEATLFTSLSCFEFDSQSSTTVTNYYDHQNNNSNSPSCPRNVLIPDTITSIAANAFKNKALTAVTIPNSVTTIGNQAFFKNALTSVTLPNTVTSLGDEAFSENDLTSITLSSGLTALANKVFAKNLLVNISLPSNLISIGDGAFFENSLTSVTLPNTVTSLGDEAFANNSIADLSIPPNLNSIGDSAFFENSSLDLVHVPSDDASIGTNAFPNGYIWGTGTRISCFDFEINNGTVKISNYETSDSQGSCPTSVVIHKGVKIIKDFAFYSKSLVSVDIPNTVTDIGEEAFLLNSLTSLILPNSVTTLGDYAFEENSISQVTLSSTLTSIGVRAFSNNQITSLTIPSSIQTVKDGAFRGNLITSLTLNNGLISIGEYSFADTSLTTLVIPDSVTSLDRGAFYSSGINNLTLGSGLTSIPYSAFQNNPLENGLSIPSSVISIEENAFGGVNSLTSVTIPSNVTSVGRKAFTSNSFTSFTISNEDAILHHEAFPNGVSVSQGDSSLTWPPSETRFSCFTFNSSETTILSYNLNDVAGTCPKNVIISNGITSIADNAFENKGIQSIDFVNTITSIGNQAFKDNSLSSITLPTALTSIGNQTFRNNNLSSMTLPTALTSIGDQAFKNNQIPSLVLNSNLETLGEFAFENNQLTSVTFNNTIDTIEDGVFKNNSLTIFSFPNQLVSIGNSAFQNNDLENLTFNNNLEHIGNKAFKNNSLSSVTFNDGLLTIGDNAFDSEHYLYSHLLSYNRNEITSIIIPNSVTSIGAEAFKGNLITSLTLGTSLQTIGDEAFNENDIPGTLTLPNTITSIGAGAFQGNPITSLTLGTSVQTIGDEAFLDCEIAGTLTIPNTTTSIGAGAFQGNLITSLTLGTSVQTIGDEAFLDCEIAGALTIPNTTTSIGIRAFQGNLMTSLTLGTGLQTIGDEAFLDCKITGALTLPNSLTFMGAKAFYNNNINSLTINTNLTEISDYAFYKNNFSGLTIPDNIEIIGEGAFRSSRVNDVDLGSGVVTIKHEAFRFCRLSTLVIPNNVVRIESYAFGNNQTSSLTIGTGIEYIGDYAFYWMDNDIGTIHIPRPESEVTLGNAWPFLKLNGLNAPVTFE